MKMTMHIDDALLARVMAATGASSKTAAIDLALRELDRRAELKRLAARGLGLETNELKELFDPAFDLAAQRELEKPVTYARKSTPRR
jgi:Arc/MetJ family transcription regulator